MDDPQPSADFEITEVIRAEMHLRMQQLPLQRRTTFFGPRTDTQRLIELELVFAAIQHATQELRARGQGHGIVLISLDGQRFWYLPFSLFPTIVPGLPADAVETLSLVEQICAQTDEIVHVYLCRAHKEARGPDELVVVPFRVAGGTTLGRGARVMLGGRTRDDHQLVWRLRTPTARRAKLVRRRAGATRRSPIVGLPRQCTGVVHAAPRLAWAETWSWQQ